MHTHTHTHTHTLLTWLIEQARANNHESIKPPSRLIQPFGNEISRETLLEAINILEGIVQLCVRHGPGLEPTVKHFVNTL